MRKDQDNDQDKDKDQDQDRDQDQDQDQNPSPAAPSFFLLYLSRCLAAWGTRTWSFVGSLFLVRLDSSESLQLMAAYGLISCLTLMVLGNAMGRLVDTLPRDRMMAAAVITQNFAISLSCLILALYFGDTMVITPRLTLAVSVVVLLLSPFSFLSQVAGRTSVEKDWVVCMCEGDTARLAMVNTNLWTIDHFCNLLAPLLAGQILTYSSYVVAAVLLMFWVLISGTVELLLLRQTFKTNEILQTKQSAERSRSASPGCGGQLAALFSGWKSYYGHPVREAGLGLALLYMTVLAPANVTWGYCKNQGVSEAVLGGMTALSALVGAVSTRLFPLLFRRLGLTSTGLLGFSLQSSCLVLCVASVWAPGSPFSLTTDENSQPQEDNSLVSVIMLLTGIISSRFGMWLADIAVNQIFQEELAEEYRGSVCGVQTGLQSLMDLIKYLLVVLLPKQNTFGFLIILSFLSVVSGGTLFLKYKLRAKQSVFETKPDTENPPQHRNLAFVTGEVGGGKGAGGGEGTGGGAGHQLEEF